MFLKRKLRGVNLFNLGITFCVIDNTFLKPNILLSAFIQKKQIGFT